MKTDIKKSVYSIVRIISQLIDFDMQLPYKINNIAQSIGSGFFYDKRGYLITCFHVVMNSKSILVEIPQEGLKKYPAFLVAACPYYDIAVLHVPLYKPRHVLSLSTSHELYQGEDVEAIGFPLGMDAVKVTKGIISGMTFGSIQTDTPLNPGNSGGPLLYQNKVIGINSSGIMGSSNIGFAVPILKYFLVAGQINFSEYEKSFKKYLTKMKTLVKSTNVNKKNKLSETPYMPKIINRPYLGINFQPTNEALLSYSQSTCGDGGILVNYIHPLSPLKKEGVETGDIICGINGKRIDENGLVIINNKEKMSILDYMDNIPFESKLSLTYTHEGKKKNTSFQYKYKPYPMDFQFPLYDKIDYEIILGFCFMNLSKNLIYKMEELAKYMNLENREQNQLVVSFAFPVSYTSKTEVIMPGDIIHKVNNHRVNSLEEFRRAFMKFIKIKNKMGVSIETRNNKLLIVYLDDILRNEQEIAETYNYPEQLLMHKIMRKMRK